MFTNRAENRAEIANAGARLILAPDWKTILWSEEERKRGQAWGLQTMSLSIRTERRRFKQGVGIVPTRHAKSACATQEATLGLP